MDKRKNRVQPIRLTTKFFPLDIHKSLFINDLMMTIPQYYAETWGDSILSKHNTNNKQWKIDVNYESPKEIGKVKYKHKAVLSLFFAKKRSQTSSYRLKWDNAFAIQLAQDYPKSFVRSLEFHIGDEYYKEQRFTEFDIGGFKEQLQVKIIWKPRQDISKELNENNIYLLLNRKNKEIYFGETKKSLSKRYPINQKHHSFDDWMEYSIIQLPPETSKHTRLLIERVLIAVGSKLFTNTIYSEEPVLDKTASLKLKNKKK